MGSHSSKKGGYTTLWDDSDAYKVFYRSHPELDDEVEVPVDDLELAEPPEGVLECLEEESPETLMEAAAAPEAQPAEEATPPSPVEPGRPQSSSEHQPYYYFYQGMGISLSRTVAFHESCLLIS